MFRPKILFIDLDGTLLDKGIGVWAKMSQKNEEAVREFSKTGIVVLSTGRVVSDEVKEIAKKVNAKFSIFQNGSIILDENFNEIQNLGFSAESVQKIVDYLKKYKFTFAPNPGNFLYGRGFWEKVFCKFSHFDAADYDDFVAQEANKILVIANSQKRIKKFHNYIEEKYDDFLNAKVVGKGFAIEVTRSDCSKGIAALKICQMLNIDPKETAHIGDSMNDSSTKDIVGNLIAMRSGSRKLKKLADQVGPAKHFGGVAKIINSFPK
ncbi:HAD-IIB family hydrolase [Mycoplasma procyoni]|uniref:HAD-IIB family hydrolase n=1 Tax=Mycoplasma procyoni TaxID=568784 RepID=UPI00197B85FA|nr:HAD-IIB family hydrolase [Mycoplasma procyoni]MBN3534621.1 HAD-IIB family hydrolase [Mycoplasma procyoni]